MNAKNPSGLGIRKRTNAHHSLSGTTWRSLAADELEATNRALGELIETFETLNETAAEINDGLKAINADLRVILGDVSAVTR